MRTGVNGKKTLGSRIGVTGYLFASPWIIGFFVFVAGPAVMSLYLSLTDFDIINPARWTGIANYRHLFLDDELFWTSLSNTMYYAVFSIPLQILLGIALAVLMNQKLPGIKYFRTIYYLPTVISGVGLCVLWRWVLSPDYGLVNSILQLVGVHGPLWLLSPAWSKPSLILMGLWGVGGPMVIYLAGLQSIPEHLYEAARIDGAGSFQRFVRITLPMLSPTIFYQVIMTTIAAFQVFTQAYVMSFAGGQVGGPLDSTLFYALYLFQNAFQWFKMGYASAMAWALLLITLAVTMLNFKLGNRWVYYEASDAKH